MDQNPDESLFELQLDHESGSYFRESSKWAKFLSVTYFVAIGFFILVLVFGTNAIINVFGQLTPDFAGAGGFLIGVIIGVLAIVFLTTFLLYRFATLTKQGIEGQDQIVFNKGLQALKNYFMIYGVLTLLSFVFSLITTVTGMVN